MRWTLFCAHCQKSSKCIINFFNTIFIFTAWLKKVLNSFELIITLQSHNSIDFSFSLKIRQKDPGISAVDKTFIYDLQHVLCSPVAADNTNEYFWWHMMEMMMCIVTFMSFFSFIFVEIIMVLLDAYIYNFCLLVSIESWYLKWALSLNKISLMSCHFLIEILDFKA